MNTLINNPRYRQKDKDNNKKEEIVDIYADRLVSKQIISICLEKSDFYHDPRKYSQREGTGSLVI